MHKTVTLCIIPTHNYNTVLCDLLCIMHIHNIIYTYNMQVIVAANSLLTSVVFLPLRNGSSSTTFSSKPSYILKYLGDVVYVFVLEEFP